MVMRMSPKSIPINSEKKTQYVSLNPLLKGPFAKKLTKKTTRHIVSLKEQDLEAHAKF